MQALLQVLPVSQHDLPIPLHLMPAYLPSPSSFNIDFPTPILQQMENDVSGSSPQHDALYEWLAVEPTSEGLPFRYEFDGTMDFCMENYYFGGLHGLHMLDYELLSSLSTMTEVKTFINSTPEPTMIASPCAASPKPSNLSNVVTGTKCTTLDAGLHAGSSPRPAKQQAGNDSDYIASTMERTKSFSLRSVSLVMWAK
uniref:Uncharacterized protein n=1 Tax=Moniliophthora roreri TaxID=221103 RepID=A0A0W0G3L6_MONRR